MVAIGESEIIVGFPAVGVERLPVLADLLRERVVFDLVRRLRGRRSLVGLLALLDVEEVVRRLRPLGLRPLGLLD